MSPHLSPGRRLGALALIALSACDPVKASLDSGALLHTGAPDSGAPDSATPSAPDSGETGSIDIPETGDTGGASSPACALEDGALPLQAEGEFLARDMEISGTRARCFTALHAAAGAAGSTLRVGLETWTGAGGATLTVTDLLGATLSGPLSLEPGQGASFSLVQTGEVFLRLAPTDPEEDANTYTLSVSCEAGCDAEYTRYPIVLMHGMGGTDTYLGLLDYYFGVADQLSAAGYRVETPTVDAFAPIADRAAQWSEALHALAEAGVGRRFVLIAHSQGGLDARYLLSTLGEDSVVALVTVASPHRGSLIADAANGVLELGPTDGALLDAALAGLAGLIGLEGDALSAQVEDLTTASMEAFNAANPDVDGVYYSSWAGHSCGALDWGCQWSNHGEIVDPLLSGTGLLLDWLDGDNDGLVSVESATWGDYQGELPADHLDEVGQIADVWNPSFDHLQFYLDEARRMAALGY